MPDNDPFDIDMEGHEYLLYERVLVGRFKKMEDVREAIEHRKVAKKFPSVYRGPHSDIAEE